MANDTDFIDSNTSSYLEDATEEENVSGLTDYIKGLFSRAEDAKYQE